MFIATYVHSYVLAVCYVYNTVMRDIADMYTTLKSTEEIICVYYLHPELN